MDTIIVWFRRDLRLGDNPALVHALRSAQRVVPVYVHAPEEERPWPAGAASRWWLHHSLQALSGSLRAEGSRLIVRRGKSADELRKLAHQLGAHAVYCNRTFEPTLEQRDRRVQRSLQQAGVEFRRFDGALLHDPESVCTAKGDPYRVFTAFWNACLKHGLDADPLPAPRTLPPVARNLAAGRVADLQLLPMHAWDGGLYATWDVGESAAQRRLITFCHSDLSNYPQRRDCPAENGTSGLSPHLHFGELSPRQVLYVLHREGARSVKANEAFTRELGWREFAYHILHHFPGTTLQPLHPQYRRFPWNRGGRHLLRAWQRGHTGIPIVDAGMRELWHTGWMHNRARMVSASFLVKNGLISWTRGARWFWDTLVDADLASNTLNWQWVAGCGADAAPYFRIFNPVRQSRRFDPQGTYLRRWLPELASLPERWIHEPWKAPAEVCRKAGLRMDVDYPAPVLDPVSSARRALRAYREHLGTRSGKQQR